LLTEENATIIYGLDADLIFLSMASQIPNIYLLREVDQFTKSDTDYDADKDAIETELCYADIDFAKQSINNEFNEYYQKYITSNNDDYSNTGMFGNDEKYEKKENKHINMFNFTNDYIFICYFLGNDFLPHLPSIDINMDGLETLFNCYMDVFQNLGHCLMSYNEEDKIVIDTEFLREFITLVATKEEDFFKRVMPSQLKRQRNRRCFETEPHKKEIWMIENLKNVKVDDDIRLGDGEADEWKFRYYSHYFHTSEHMVHTIDTVTHNYIEGLLWVTRYYFEKCPTWRWQYNFTHAPFLSDIMRYIKNKDIMKDFETPVEVPVDMYTQLVSVIPSTYSNILPNALRHLNNSPDSPIIDMYPLTYEIDMINKTQLYKCIPMIPYLDVGRVENAIKGMILSNSDKIRCVSNEPFNLGVCAKPKLTLNQRPKINPKTVSANHICVNIHDDK
jgi:5'-3' exonuclease